MNECFKESAGPSFIKWITVKKNSFVAVFGQIFGWKFSFHKEQ